MIFKKSPRANVFPKKNVTLEKMTFFSQKQPSSCYLFIFVIPYLTENYFAFKAALSRGTGENF